MKNVFKVLMYFCFAIGFLYSAVFFYNEMRVGSTTAVFGIVLNIVCGIVFIVEVVFEFSKRRDKSEEDWLLLYDNGKLSKDKKINSNIMVVIYLFLIIAAFVTVSAHIYYMNMNNIMDVCFGVISFILAGVCGIAVLLLEVSGKNKWFWIYKTAVALTIGTDP